MWNFFFQMCKLIYFAITTFVIILEEIASVPYFVLLIAPPDFQTFHRFYGLFQGGERKRFLEVTPTYVNLRKQFQTCTKTLKLVKGVKAISQVSIDLWKGRVLIQFQSYKVPIYCQTVN